jgi:hypothetical protein
MLSARDFVLYYNVCVLGKKPNIRKNCLQANVSSDEVSGERSERKNQVHLVAGHCGVRRLPV